MSTIKVCRKLTFCAGHRVLGHEGKCANPHGHNYIVLVYASAPELDSVGRVIDFSVLKEKIGGWIDRNWDHSFLFCVRDTELVNAFHNTKWPCFPMLDNPTAEIIAAFLLRGVCPKVLEGTGVLVDKVQVWETENCMAEVVL